MATTDDIANHEPAGRPTGILELISFTDPYCTWCWGSEPIMRRITETYGRQIEVRYVMGGLVEHIDNFFDKTNNIGGPGSLKQVAAHWLEASRRHGMPVNEQVWLKMDDWVSTHPANIAFKAAEMQNTQLAGKYLRRLREAASAEGLFIHRPEVQAELAGEVGLDPERLLADIAGPARDAFDADLSECRRLGVRGFPTFLVRNERGDERLMRGYQSFQAFAQVFEIMTGGAIERKEIIADDESIAVFIAKYGNVAPREVAEVFSLTVDEAEEVVNRLIEDGRIMSKPAGNGIFYSPATNPLFCDAGSGICGI